MEWLMEELNAMAQASAERAHEIWGACGTFPQERSRNLRAALTQWRNLGQRPHWWPQKTPWPTGWTANGQHPETFAGLTFALEAARKKFEILF